MNKSYLFFFVFILAAGFLFTASAQDISVNPNPPIQSNGQLNYDGTDAITITHSVDPVSVVAGMSVACTAGGITSDNQYWRSFVLSDFGITDPWDITMVEIGVESAIAGSGGEQPLTVNLYTADTPWPTLSLTPIGTATVMVPDQSLTLFQIPVTGTAPAGSELVVEINIEDATTGANHTFFLGANNTGQTADSWLSSTGCGLPGPPAGLPVTTQSIGFPDAQWVMSVTGDDPIPVELTSFTANVNGNDVQLNWSTASETNNSGFEVERNSGHGFVTIAFIEGFGTTSEVNNYSYADNSLNVGSYSYRLKQVDLDGTFSYSNVAAVEVIAPEEYSLDQNYPNPFNPSTIINFNLAADSRVSLKVYDILGTEVTTLINRNFTAGTHQVEFSAENLNSGMYFYRLDAAGSEGQEFSSVKKMMLIK